MFEELYESKTGNIWGNIKNFVKHPNKFYPLEIDYGQVSIYFVCFKIVLHCGFK